MAKATWHFDFISPLAHLQLARFAALPGDLQITPVTVVFGGLLKHWGQLRPAEISPKRRFVYRFFHWHADKLGVPFRMPGRHPYNPLASPRLCVVTGASIDHARAIFEIIYGPGIQPDTPEGIDAMAHAVGVSDSEAAISDSEIKETLRRNTEAAIAHRVFGVPTFVIDGQVFWGGDATDMLLDYLADPALFQTPEMQRISGMPMGLTRQQ